MSPEEVLKLVVDERFVGAVKGLTSSSQLNDRYLIAGIIGAIISGLAFIAIAVQTWLFRKQAGLAQKQLNELHSQVQLMRGGTTADHDRGRREFAVRLCLEWSQYLQQETRDVRDFIESAPAEICEKIVKSEEFNVDDLRSESKKKLEKALAHKNEGLALGEKIDAETSSYLRWIAISYLNALDAILIARQYNVADKRIIDDSFAYLVINGGAMQSFRLAAGVQYHKGIAKFIGEMNDKEKSKLECGAPPADTILADAD